MNKYCSRKKIRLDGYDYSKEGLYFITICTYNRQILFGQCEKGRIILNEFGIAAEYTLKDLENYNNVIIHEYIIMPEHIHAIIELYIPEDPFDINRKSNIPEVIRQFKNYTARRINKICTDNGADVFPPGKLWQKSYFDHVIRNIEDHELRKKYILDNPTHYDLGKY